MDEELEHMKRELDELVAFLKELEKEGYCTLDKSLHEKSD